MNAEYLILNIIIILGPLVLSFDRRVNFMQYWSKLFQAIIIFMIPFIVWDNFVTNRHWWFNEQFTLDFRLLNLPLGEWLFFVTVPYACIFTWEVLVEYFSNREWHSLKYLAISIFVITIPIASIMLYWGKEYSGIVLYVFGLVFLLDYLFRTKIFMQRRTYIFSLLLILMMLIFNGYLTARPVVLYDPQYQLDFRIYTIPIEDFFYGFALIFGILVVFEKLKRV